MIFQLVGTMNCSPILGLIHKTSASYILRLIAWTKTPYGFWELDSSISPRSSLPARLWRLDGVIPQTSF